jgi:hypothetical protein
VVLPKDTLNRLGNKSEGWKRFWIYAGPDAIEFLGRHEL